MEAPRYPLTLVAFTRAAINKMLSLTHTNETLDLCLLIYRRKQKLITPNTNTIIHHASVSSFYVVDNKLIKIIIKMLYRYIFMWLFSMLCLY